MSRENDGFLCIFRGKWRNSAAENGKNGKAKMAGFGAISVDFGLWQCAIFEKKLEMLPGNVQQSNILRELREAAALGKGEKDAF